MSFKTIVSNKLDSRTEKSSERKVQKSKTLIYRGCFWERSQFFGNLSRKPKTTSSFSDFYPSVLPLFHIWPWCFLPLFEKKFHKITENNKSNNKWVINQFFSEKKEIENLKKTVQKYDKRETLFYHGCFFHTSQLCGSLGQTKPTKFEAIKAKNPKQFPSFS